MLDELTTIPSDVTAEKHVLAISILDGEKALVQVKDLLRPIDFFTLEHGELYGLLLSMLRDGKPVELAAIAVELRRTGRLEAVGGAIWLSDLADMYGFAGANIIYYAKRLRELADLRGMISVGTKLSHEARQTGAEAGELASRFMADLHSLGERHAGAEVSELSDAMDIAISKADAIARGEQAPGLPTGFPEIEQASGPLSCGDLWVVGAATSVGKSAFAHAVARTVANAGYGVLVVSAEMPREAVANRLLSAESGIESSRLRIGHLYANEDAVREEARARMAGWRLAIMDQAASIPEISIRAKMLASKWGGMPALIVLDYLQLLTPDSGETRAQQVGAIAWAAKRLAMELNCAVLLLSQLNRQGVRPGAVGNEGTPPTLHDLKESGDIENSGNVVLLLHRPVNYVIDMSGTIPIWCKIAKARDGMTTPWPSTKHDMAGAITLRFRPKLTRFGTQD